MTGTGEDLAVGLAGSRAAGDVRALWRHLIPTGPPPGGFDPASVAELPEPARRWLRHVITPGMPLARAVVLRMRGHIRLGRWLPFHAVQLHAPPHGYVWVACAELGPVKIRGYDAYTAATGTMRWRLSGRIPIVDAGGPDVDRSAAGRVALDAFTVPTRWLAPSVAWSAGADSDRAVAEWTIGGHTLRPEIQVRADGSLQSIRMLRWAAPHRAPWAEYPCGGALDAEIDFGGITIPSVTRAGYFFGTDRWAANEFFRATISAARFL